MRSNRQAVVAATLLILCAGSIVPSAAQQSAVSGSPAMDGAGAAGALGVPAYGQAVDGERPWRGPDGETVPFTTSELEDFLREAEVTERVPINVGINGIDRLVLEKGGIRIRAGFRDVDIQRRNQRVGKEMYFVFRDHYAFEVAAYELAKLLGMDNLPPAVLRRVGRTEGSVQAWVESNTDYTASDFTPPGAAWAKQMAMMRFFDSLVYNVDRNPGNLISDDDYKLWMIDHTRAFQERSDLFEPDRVNAIERGVWERIQALSDDDLKRAFDGLLESSQVSRFIERRDRMVALIEERIAERGQSAVIF